MGRRSPERAELLGALVLVLVLGRSDRTLTRRLAAVAGEPTTPGRGRAATARA